MHADNISPMSDGAFMQSILASGPALFVMDIENKKIVFANTTFLSETGYSNEDINGNLLDIFQLVAPHERERLEYEISELPHLPDPCSNRHFIYHLCSSRGELLCRHMYVSRMQQNGKATSCYIFTLMAESSKQELPYISSDTRTLCIEQFSEIGYGCFEWVIDNNRVYWSDGIYRIYEIEKGQGDITHEALQAMTHSEDRKRMALFLRKAMEDGGEYSIETRIVTARQNLKIINSVVKVIKSDAGKPCKLVGCVKDVTAQRMIEEDLKRHVKELNHSNRELEEFAYVASHDLQEPLRKISTFGRLLSEKYANALSGDGQEYLERMVKASDNMKVLINNLLEFSRITKEVKAHIPINLNFVLSEVKADLNLLLEETETVIESESLPVIEGSMTQMKQLFSNLINNAVKFQQNGNKPFIRIKGRVITQEEIQSHNLNPSLVYHSIEVSDNGIGFDPEYSTHIFKIFQRLHGKSAYPGSGLGLAICQRIVENHHGVIYACGFPSEGAVFTFILPEKHL